MLVFALLLLFGCAGEKNGSASGKEAKKSGYYGFMDLKAGMWAETVTRSGSDKVTLRTELLEYSPTLAKFQMISDAGGVKSVSQVWSNPKDGSLVKYVMKSGSEVLCMEVSKAPSGQVPSEGDEYPPKPGVSLGTYTTPNGKTVEVAKFSTSSGEVWVSSEVPFGLVKVVTNGNTAMSLYDFGTIGARSLISDDDIADCTDMSGMADAAYGAAQEIDYAEYDEEYDYEAYREESDTYSSDVKEAGTGKSASVSCSACDQMPEAARNACLAACG